MWKRNNLGIALQHLFPNSSWQINQNGYSLKNIDKRGRKGNMSSSQKYTYRMLSGRIWPMITKTNFILAVDQALLLYSFCVFPSGRCNAFPSRIKEGSSPKSISWISHVHGSEVYLKEWSRAHISVFLLPSPQHQGIIGCYSQQTGFPTSPLTNNFVQRVQMSWIYFKSNCGDRFRVVVSTYSSAIIHVMYSIQSQL